MKCLWIVVFFLFVSICSAQIVDIPDPNFKNYLVTNTEVNTNGDSEIQVSEAEAFTGSLAFQFWFVEDLTGIEAFVNLTFLDCGDNKLTELDLSQNLALEQLYCYDNQLTSLDLSANTALFALDCRNNAISDLDLSGNPALEYLQCTFNEMNSLNLTQNLALNTLRCFSNNFTELDLSNNSELVNLYASFNDIESLDLSQNEDLVIIECSFNELTALDVSNGNNSNVTTYTSLGNPDLECIKVDNMAYSEANWTNVDPTSMFSEDCEPLNVTTEVISELSIYPNPATESVYITLPHSNNERIDISVFNLNGRIVIAESVDDATAMNLISLNTSELNKGVYFLQLNTSEAQLTSKLIIE